MKLYEELAAWWPLISAPADYEEEAASYARILAGASDIPIRTVPELGSGGGNNASHLKARFDMVLVEPSAGMLHVSRAPSTDCGGHDGDISALRYLEWTWDPDPADTTYCVDYAYLLRTADGAVRLEHSELEPGSHEVFVAQRPPLVVSV